MEVSEGIIIALIGVGGAVIGSIATVAVKWLEHYLSRETEKEKDKKRKGMLKDMLNHPEYTWRELSTLMHTIGSDEETTKRLLLEIDARASENGKPLWALISRAPLPSKQ